MTQALAAVSISGSSTNVAEPSETVKKLLALRDELRGLFPEREELIDQMIYAVMIREHVLVYGVFGTGKSHFVSSFFGSFIGASMYSIELTKFMTEANAVGIPNPKILREEGRIFHERKGTMLDAVFCELDEFFDANDHLLRTLLGILNERRFNRGVQLEQANLHTALASTNADPRKEIMRSPTLGAVVDRFLFQTDVGYLEKPESRRKMFANYMSRRVPQTKIDYADLSALSKAVLAIPIDDPVLIDLHEQILTGARKLRLKEDGAISDRRACQAFKVVQAHAMLYGRTDVLPEDFLATKWVYCFDDDKVTHEKFAAMASPLIEKIVKERQPDVVATQMRLFDEYATQIPKLTGSSKPEPAELVVMNRTLVELIDKVGVVQPAHVAIEDRKKALLKELESAKEKVGRLIDGRPI